MNTIEIILPLFILTFIGFLLKKYNILNKDSISGINKIIYYIALPSLLFLSISNIKLDNININLILAFIFSTIIITFISYIISTKLNKDIKGPFIMCSFRGNIAYLGLPIATMLGENSLSSASIIIAFAIPLYVILSIAILQNFNKSKLDIKDSIKKLLLNPLMISIFLGLLFSKTNIPTQIINTLKMIGNISLPLALILIGSTISFKSIKKYYKISFISSALKMLILPFIGFMLAYYMNINQSSLPVLLILLLMPTAVASYSFTKELGGDENYTATQISISTLFFLIQIPLILMILL